MNNIYRSYVCRHLYESLEFAVGMSTVLGKCIGWDDCIIHDMRTCLADDISRNVIILELVCHVLHTQTYTAKTLTAC